MSKATGVVESIKAFGDVKKMYSVTVSGKRYGFGSYPPKCEVGDEVEFLYEQKGEYMNADNRSLVVIAKATAASLTSAAVAGSKSYGKDPATQTTISKQAALNSAIAFVNILAHMDAVPGVTKTAKPEDRYAILEGIVTEKTKEFYFQSTGTEFPEVAVAEQPKQVAGSDWR